jgi:hypothetical protein
MTRSLRLRTAWLLRFFLGTKGSGRQISRSKRFNWVLDVQQAMAASPFWHPGWLRDDPDNFTHTGFTTPPLKYDSFDDLTSSFARLKQSGIEPDHFLDHGVADIPILS